MSLIYCQIENMSGNFFRLIRSRYVGLSGNEIANHEVEAESRLQAAILNVGFACRHFKDYESDADIKIVGIESDKDGAQLLHDGEMDSLYYLLNPSNDFEARKLRSLYHRHERYLGRIKTLQLQLGIRFVLQDRHGDIRYY